VAHTQGSTILMELEMTQDMRLITMSAREFDRLKTIQAIIDGNLRPITAANRLHLSRRQVDRYGHINST